MKGYHHLRLFTIFKRKVRLYGLKPLIFLLYLIFPITLILSNTTSVNADESPFKNAVDETLMYFKPLKGTIISIEGKKAKIDLGKKHGVKNDMRFTIFREQAPFKHPVTKELLGNLESIIGKLHIIEANEDSSIGEIIEGNANVGDKIRISEIKINLLFYQSNTSDWYTADSYYRELKNTGRFNMIDTSLDTSDPNEIIKEAKRLNADVVIYVNIQEKENKIALIQDLYWVTDGYRFGHSENIIEGYVSKEAKFADKFYKFYKEEPWLDIELPFSAKLITIADLNGDKKQELIFATDNDIGVHNLYESKDYESIEKISLNNFKADEILWLDSIDMNKNGRDEIILTFIKDKKVESHIYELNDKSISLIFKYPGFLRNLNGSLIGQEYSPSNGFEGPVFNFIYKDGYKKGDALKIPENISIYDFIYIEIPPTRYILTYDERGYLNLYDDSGRRIWKSKESSGGFLKTFSKSSPTVMVERGEWSIKDRLFFKSSEALFVKRIPLLNMVKGLGYKNSQICKLYWNGLTMEESTLINNISGNVLDYLISGDKIYVLSSPFLGFKPEKILKGENPLKTTLYIYSLKGMYY